MRRVLSVIICTVAFFLELILGSRMALGGVRPPLTAAALFFFFWDIKLPSRIFWAVIFGILLESVSWHQSGVITTALTVSAFFTDISRSLLSHTESPLTRGIHTALAIFLYLNIMLVLDFFLGIIRGGEPFMTLHFWWNIFSASILWALLLPAFFAIPVGLRHILNW